jgi:hypothetical protein
MPIISCTTDIHFYWALLYIFNIPDAACNEQGILQATCRILLTAKISLAMALLTLPKKSHAVVASQLSARRELWSFVFRVSTRGH